MTEEVAAEGPYAVIMAPTRELAQQVPPCCFYLSTSDSYCSSAVTKTLQTLVGSSGVCLYSGCQCSSTLSFQKAKYAEIRGLDSHKHSAAAEISQTLA